MFYSNISFKDAGFDSDEITFFCYIKGKLVVKSFKPVEWLEYEKRGEFDMQYSNFIKSKKKSNFSYTKFVGKGDGKFRRKKLV